MTPLISPWVFYLMPICENVHFVCSVFGVIAMLGAVVVTIAHTTTKRDRYADENDTNMLRDIKRILVPLATVLMLLSIFIPTEKTLTKMLIAQNVTYERVEVATDTVQSVYEDIMSLFEEDDNG